MELIRIYKDMEVTYQEFENALEHLDFTKIIKKHQRLYVNKAHDSIVAISELNTPDRMMVKGEFAAQSYTLEMKGVIEHRDDIAKMIEQARLAVQQIPLNVAVA
jgi:hypothetical protein